MAEIVISPLLQSVFDRLTSLVLTNLGIGSNFTKDIEGLRRTLPIIQAVIEDAEDQQLKDRKVGIWLKRLKDVAQDADDLLDELNTHVLRKTLKKKKKVWLTLLTLQALSINSKMCHKVKEIRGGLDDIARDISNFQLNKVVVYERSDTRERRETGPDVDETEVYGRKEDTRKIVDLLLGDHQMGVSVFPIVGIGGIGKTTLAQLAYNDERVTGHFDVRMWVSVYDSFSVKTIINEILYYTTKHKCESSQIGVLQSHLRESISGKRYLLVLDDVWNEDQDEWDKLRNPLRFGADGSKVLVTTRSQKVASIMSTTCPYVLEALADDDCWTLFKQHAFAKGELVCHPNLLRIGLQIVKKCKGVPLAAKILGRLMHFKREESEWSRVQGSELWNLDEGENRILSVLKLSYNHLPAHLKRCFAYCAIFPKHYEISREKLIHLWVAEGLIQAMDDRRHGKTMEDVGNEYFNDLLLMCFFQGISKCDDGSIITFIMHDLIHALAQSVAGYDILMLGHNNASTVPTEIHTSVLHGNLAKTRHATVDCNFKSSFIPDTLYGAKKLRTLSLRSLGDNSGKVLPTAIRNFKHLRVLDLSGSGIERLHKSIGDLIYLRYLDLSSTLIQTLPETIGHLCNLQTLNLSSCSELIMLPSGLTNLINLRHLNIKECTRLACLPANIGYLHKLQTLPIFIVGRTKEDGLRQLKHLDLRGELKIKQLQNAGGTSLPNVLLEMQLHSLGLSWWTDNEEKLEYYSSRPPAGGYRTSQVSAEFGSQVSTEYVISRLRPNLTLRRLSIIEYSGSVFPDWVNDLMLPSLRQLVLINCIQCEYLPTLGQLQFLKVLTMKGMDAVVNIKSEFYGEEDKGPFPSPNEGGEKDKGAFPSLNDLTLRDFPNLKIWETVSSKVAFRCLERLSIIKCPGLTTMPWFPILRHLELRHCSASIFRSAAELKSLSTLVIDFFPELFFLPEALLQNNSLLVSLTISSCPRLNSLPASLENLAVLESLSIRWCESIDTLPGVLGNLTSLETLEIIECPRLIFLPKSIERLSSLRSFSIENCENLTLLPKGMEHLIALEHLTIMYCSNLTSLPDGLQHLPALRSLSILSCPMLASLPQGLQHAKTLQNLEIRSCSNFQILPDLENLNSLRSLAISECHSIKSLPEGLQKLSALQHLSIKDCPELERRCEKGRGEDWHKVSHIPFIHIGSPVLQERSDIATSSSNP